MDLAEVKRFLGRESTMWKLAAMVLVGGALLLSQGCCWPMYERHHHHHGDWDDQGRYERAPAPRPWTRPGRD
jgi:hypothetical protein